MFTNLNKLKDIQLDLLKEVGNIGAGHAATALSMMIKKQVDMKVPKVRIIPFNEIEEYLGGEEQIVVGIFLRVEGDVPGNMFFVFNTESALRLLNYMLDKNITDYQQLTELDYSALSEIGNILSGSYLSSLADFTNLYLSPSVPSITIDMVGAILSFGLIQISQYSDAALVIDTTFFEGQSLVEGQFFLIPDPESFEKLFSALGVLEE